MINLSDQEILDELISRCKVSEIPEGHNASFEGHSANFRSTTGADEWTRDMACRAAILFWAIDMRNNSIERVTF